jgi:hypothetical protein
MKIPTDATDKDFFGFTMFLVKRIYAIYPGNSVELMCGDKQRDRENLKF